MTREQTKWTAFIGQEIAAQVAKRKPHAEAIRVAYETARREYKKSHPEIHVLPDFLKEIDSFQRANKGHRGAMPIAQWPTHKKNPAKKKRRKSSVRKKRSIKLIGARAKSVSDWSVDRFKNGTWEPVASFKSTKKKEAVEYAKAYATQHGVKLKVYR